MTVKAKHARVVIEDDHSDSDSEQDSKVPSGSENESESEQIDEESLALLNEGWADSIAKILRTNKPKKKKTLVLSKAKKITDPIKKVKKESYQVATQDGRLKTEQTIVEERLVENVAPPKKKRKEVQSLRVKPNILEKDRERTMQKIATRGVVQLFNAVKNQQKDISKKLDEAGPLEVRKEKVLKSIDKRAFLDVLMGEKSSNVDELQPKQKQEWSVLRDDFLMSAKMKDWDKELEEEQEQEIEVESD